MVPDDDEAQMTIEDVFTDHVQLRATLLIVEQPTTARQWLPGVRARPQLPVRHSETY